MNLALLHRIADATAKLLLPERIVVMGSSAFLGSMPEVSSLASIETSKDADLLVTPCSEQDALIVEEALGEGRAFFRKHGVYADLLRPEVADLLPAGWEERLVPLDDGGLLFCLDVYDACAAKLRAGRPKDTDLLLAIHRMGHLDWQVLEQRLRATAMKEKEIVATHSLLKRLRSACPSDSV